MYKNVNFDTCSRCIGPIIEFIKQSQLPELIDLCHSRYPFTSGWREAIKSHCIAQEYKCQDLNPHPNNFPAKTWITQPWHASKVQMGWYVFSLYTFVIIHINWNFVRNIFDTMCFLMYGVSGAINFGFWLF